MEGYIGLAPKTTKAGYVVCMLLGSDAPLAFRPTESGKYKLVGRYYVYGLMDSEALPGSTDHFQFGWRLDEEFRYHGAYLNHETRETQVSNPR